LGKHGFDEILMRKLGWVRLEEGLFLGARKNRATVSFWEIGLIFLASGWLNRLAYAGYW